MSAEPKVTEKKAVKPEADGRAAPVSVDRDVLRTLVMSLEAFWDDHSFAEGTPAFVRDKEAIAEARNALRGRPARAAVERRPATPGRSAPSPAGQPVKGKRPGGSRKASTKS